MSGFETLGGILNIVQIIGVILNHVQDHTSIKDVLENAETRAKRIHSNIERLHCLENVGSLFSDFFDEIVHEFTSIEEELLQVKEKVTNRTAARTVLTSPSTLSQLKDITLRLKHEEQTIKLVGLIGNFNAQQYSTANDMKAGFTQILTRLPSDSAEFRTEKTLLCRICQDKFTEVSSAVDAAKRREDNWMTEVDSTTQLSLGIAFYEGNPRVPQDYFKAARFLNAALNAGRREANYYLGMMCKSGQGVSQCNIAAFEFFNSGTRANDPKAMSMLALFYLTGTGVEVNKLHGVSLAEQAANAEDPVGLSVRSWHKLYGFYTNKNSSLAFQLSEKAVEKGNQCANMNLATCYMNGIGVQRDAPKAVRLWTKAMEAGGYSCMLDLAECYAKGLGVDVDWSIAASIYKMGSEITTNSWRRIIVQPYYGLCLIRGKGVPQNVKAGWAKIQNSVHLGDSSGWFIQGQCYQHGYGVKKDLTKAVYSYKQAIRPKSMIDGKLRAWYALGCMYESGDGVKPNPSMAFEYFDFAASKMHQDAQWKIAVYCESGVGVELDLVRAAEFYRLAANSGNRDAQLKTFYYYMKGKGVQRNLMRDVEIIRPAAEAGDKEAKRLLRHLEGRRRIRFFKFKSKSAET